MTQGDGYTRQVRLLVRILPLVMAEERFALKGGTGINLFIRDLPRLSVDIDLVYLPVETRDTSLTGIDAAMTQAAARITAGLKDVRVALGRDKAGRVTKLIVSHEGATVKVEINIVFRGVVFPPEMRPVSASVEDRFGFAEVRMVSFADLYAGKIVAALDRQHPRDLFDVRDLLAVEGVSDDLRRAFLVYMISHDRPLNEVLNPSRQPLEERFDREFVGMTQEPVSLETLAAAREGLIDVMVANMPEDHRRFLIGFKSGVPDWSVIGLDHVPKLPGVLWKQQNLDKLSRERRTALIQALEAVWS